MMPLGLLMNGEQAEIMEIRGHGGNRLIGCDGKRPGDGEDRIEDMGIRVGKEIRVLNNGGQGPLPIKVDESRSALGRGMAMKILVTRKEG